MYSISGVLTLEDGECIYLNGAEYFHYSPGGYDPGNHVMTDVECKASCGSFFLPYSGILKQKLCLCARDEKGKIKSALLLLSFEYRKCKRQNLVIHWDFHSLI